MLQALREKTTGWIAFIILASVGIPFAFFGVNNYFETRTETFLAKVGKQEISSQQFRDRLERLRRQARDTQGPSFDGSYFNDPTVKRQVLDRMIEEELLRHAVVEAGAQATDAYVRREIRAIAPFQVEGKFNADQYRLLLQARQMTPAGFEDEIRRDLDTRMLPVAVGESALVADAELDRYIALRDQTRDFRYFSVVPPVVESTPPTDAELEKYLEAHRDDYQSPEQVALDYVELNAADIAVPGDVDDATLKARYEEQKARYTVPEQRLASHILVKADKNADADALKVAQAKAEELAKAARAGQDFAEIAKASSDDLGSKQQGGDLGWLEQGATQAAFETALFKLEDGQISDPVRTDDGFHVIKLREVRAGSVKVFEAVRDDLAKEYLESERERLYSDRAGRLNDLVYQNQSSLQPAADALDLKVQRTPLFARGGGTGIAANPEVLKRAFSEAVLAEGNNSDPIDVGPNHVVVIRIAEHKPKAARPLAEVRDQVAMRMRLEKQRELAKSQADELRKQIDGGAGFEQLRTASGATASEAKGTGRNGMNQDPALVEAVFKLPRTKDPKPQVVEIAGGRHAVVEVTAITDGDPKKLDAAARTAVREEYARNLGSSEVRALLEVLRARTAIKVVEERM